MPTVQAVNSAIYADASGTLINCNVLFEGNTDYVPYTAAEYDPEPSGVEFYNQLVAGVWGPISPYVPPPPQEYALISPNDKIYDNTYNPPVTLGFRVVAVSTTTNNPPAPLYWVTCPDYVTPNGYYYTGAGFEKFPAGVQ